MSFVNDTSVVSQITKIDPEQKSIAWLRRTEPSSMFISVITFLELRLGTALMPAGIRRARFEDWISRDLQEQFADRILPISLPIAEDAGRLVAQCRKSGYNIEPIDAMIASTARVHGFSVATLNRKHFKMLDVPMVDF